MRVYTSYERDGRPAQSARAQRYHAHHTATRVGRALSPLTAQPQILTRPISPLILITDPVSLCVGRRKAEDVLRVCVCVNCACMCAPPRSV